MYPRLRTGTWSITFGWRKPDRLGGVVGLTLAFCIQGCGFHPGPSRWIFLMQKIDSCPVDFRHGRHGKYPLGARYLGVECLDALGKIKFLRTNFASAKLRCLPLGKKLGDKITYGNWYRLSSAALKSDTSSWGMY
ncbi:hypothetical protein TNCV_2719751 [Trichonephila clavipes]|nr:hypothetical protein TNCV_2719751 [Trichonephila clavipes]